MTTEGIILFTIIVAVIAISIQYYVIKHAILSSLKEYEKSRNGDSVKYNNLLIALGVNPYTFNDIDNEIDGIYAEKLKELKKDKAYKRAPEFEKIKLIEELRNSIQKGLDIKKIEIMKRN